MLQPKIIKKIMDIEVLDDRTESIPEFCHLHRCPQARVADVLAGEVPLWSSRNPVLIDAPTGSGKTTFVYEVLLQDARRRGGNVLLLSNRLALSVQQKLLVNQVQGGSLDKYLTPAGLQKREDFGDVVILTYHRLPVFLQDPQRQDWIHNILYVIADEAHFFVADSLFNDLCGYYLDLVTTYFSHAVRVYMTATSWDILYPLAKAEEINFPRFELCHGWQPPRELTWYQFPAREEICDLPFFQMLPELTAAIQANAGGWLVFVDSREKGQGLSRELGDMSTYIDADSKNSETWESLTTEGRFKSRVLITTSVIDCGINILDNSVQNIALMTDDHTSFMQMLGRKRRNQDERVNLWVQVPTAKSISARLRSCDELLAWLTRYDQCTSYEANQRLAAEVIRTKAPDLRGLFHLGSGYLYRNELAYFYLRKRRRFLADLANGADFRSYVYRWLGMEPPADTSPDDLDRFCREHLGQFLSGTEAVFLRSTIVRAYIKAGNREPQQKRLEHLGPEALTNRLKSLNLPYRITICGERWVLKESGNEGE